MVLYYSYFVWVIGYFSSMYMCRVFYELYDVGRLLIKIEKVKEVYN